MEKSDEDKIRKVLQELREAVERWKESDDDDWQLEEEVIFALTIESIAKEEYPVGNTQLVADCQDEVEEVKQRDLRGESDWLDYYSIMLKVKDGEYGEVLPHLREISAIVCGMFD
jgi:seryl-tRNA synthetase